MNKLHTYISLQLLALVTLAFAIAMLSSCAGQMQKYCEKHYLVNVVDTTMVEIPYYLQKDSVVHRLSINDSTLYDTVKIQETERTRLKVQYYRDSVFILCEAKEYTDTVTRIIEVPAREGKKSTKEVIPWWIYLIGGALLLSLLMLSFRR